MNKTIQQIQRLKSHALVTLSALALPASLHAGTPAAALPAKDTPSSLDQLWSLATLYQNDTNPILQQFKLRGRYHGQYHWLDSDQGDEDGWENRRLRFGIDAKLFDKKLDLRIDAETDQDLSTGYDTLIDAYLKWHATDNVDITIGRQKPHIAPFDWLQSTNNQPTFERSQIFNQLRVNRCTGMVADGKAGLWSWQAGVYSNDIDSEFGGFDGGYSVTAGVGRDLKDLLGTDKALLHLDWLHSEAEAGDTVSNRYADIITATFWVQQDRWSLVTEAFAGTGGEDPNGDVFGFYILPSYDLVPKKLQVLARFSHATGDGPDSVVAQPRYERAAPDLSGGGRGDSYTAIYGGLQYFIHGDKLKLMAGAEYASLDGGGNGGDYDGLTVLTGVRISF